MAFKKYSRNTIQTLMNTLLAATGVGSLATMPATVLDDGKLDLHDVNRFIDRHSLLGQGYWQGMFGTDTWENANRSDMDAYMRENLANNAEALEYWNSLSDSDKENLYNQYLTEADKEGFATLGGLTGDTQEYDLDQLYRDILEAENTYQDFSAPTSEDIYKELENDKFYNERLNELANLEERQTNLFENQLQENNMMFDDYRSQVLGNQHRQNAQLLGTVGSEMDRARRNALEAGASAGLRMAENINTTLAMQNKQSQISLETSNQLAQQLLNQRQAAAGIRSDYNQMLSDNADKRESAKQFYYGQAEKSAWDKYDADKNEYITNRANSLNPIASQYDVYRNNKKSQSQYN